jgi:hypothetical protein
MSKIFGSLISFAILVSISRESYGYINFPAATSTVRKIPGFEGVTLSAPENSQAAIDQLSKLPDQLSKLPNLIQTDISRFIDHATIVAKAFPISSTPEVTKVVTSISSIVELMGSKLGSYENGVYAAYALIAFVGFSVLNLIGRSRSTTGSSGLFAEPYGADNRYNAGEAADFFSSQPLLVFNRGVEIAAVASVYGFGLLLDMISGKLEDPIQEEKRADQLVEVLTRLGPTFIKVGQSLSIRTDLLRPAYIKGLTKLQDAVPSFPTSIAREIIERDLGQSADSIFITGIEPSATVVAAASLGQVYKATLRADFSEVAIKVQRPDILVRVALDMHLLRILAVPIKALAGLQTDLQGVIDDW